MDELDGLIARYADHLKVGADLDYTNLEEYVSDATDLDVDLLLATEQVQDLEDQLQGAQYGDRDARDQIRANIKYMSKDLARILKASIKDLDVKYPNLKVNENIATLRQLLDALGTKDQDGYALKKFKALRRRVNALQKTNQVDQQLKDRRRELEDDKTSPYIMRGPDRINRDAGLLAKLQATLQNHMFADPTEVERMRETLGRYITMNERVDDMYRDARQEVQKLLERLKRVVEGRIGRAPQQTECRVDYRAQPCVRIFELTPPPPVDIKRPDLQKYVTQAFNKFTWSVAERNQCEDKFTLSPSQRFVYHYFQPFNPRQNALMVVHSAGSGKTIAGTLTMSIFARAGYIPIIMSTRASQKEAAYIRSIIDDGGDFNVQQYLHVNGVSSLKSAHVLSGSDKKIIELQKGDLAQRGWVTTVYKAMDLEFPQMLYPGTITNLVLNITAKGRWEYYKKRQQRLGFTNTDDDPLQGLFLIVDEPHKFLTYTTVDDSGNWLAFTLACWKSYNFQAANADYKSVKVLLSTATPIVEHPADLIYLMNACVPQSEAIFLIPLNDMKRYAKMRTREYGAVLAKEVLPKWRRAFEAKFWDQYDAQSLGTWKGLPILQQYLNGRISYLQMNGNRGAVADMNVNFVNVYISKYQEDTVQKCFRTYANLEFKDGQWQRTVDEKKVSKTKDPLAIFEVTEEEEQQQDLGVKGGKLSECIRNNFVWPKDYSDPNKLKKESSKARLLWETFIRGEYKGKKKIRQSKVSQLVKEGSQLLDLLIQNINRIRERRKQVIYVDSSQDKLLWFIGNVLATLLNYNFVDDLEQGSPYANMAVIGSKGAGRRIEAFNDPSNITGRHINILLYNNHYREGFTFKHVGYVHIVSLQTGRQELIQAVARSVRFCSHAGLPYPWTVEIFVYYSYIHYRGKLRQSTRSIQDQLEALLQKDRRREYMIDQAYKLIGGVAVDKGLNEPINRASENTLGRIQVSDPRMKGVITL